MKLRIKLALLCALLFGVFGGAWASQTAKDVKRIYEKIVRANGLSKPLPILVLDCGLNNKTGRPVVNAFNTGKFLIICTTYLNQRIKNKEELALVIGHELAHSRWKTEQRADEYGALYARAAGYNYCRGAKMFKRMGQGDMPIHPPGQDRYKAMRCN